MTHTAGRMTEIGGALGQQGVTVIAAALRKLLADAFALYLKTKGFHWHISGPHFRDYHLLLDEQAGQLFNMTGDIAERARKIGATSLRSIGDVVRHQRLKDSDESSLAATTSLIEVWIGQTERRSWFLIQTLDADRGEPANIFGTGINAG